MAETGIETVTGTVTATVTGIETAAGIVIETAAETVTATVAEIETETVTGTAIETETVTVTAMNPDLSPDLIRGLFMTGKPAVVKRTETIRPDLPGRGQWTACSLLFFG